MSNLPRPTWLIATICALAFSSLSAPAQALDIASRPMVLGDLTNPVPLSVDLTGAFDDSVQAGSEQGTAGEETAEERPATLAALVRDHLSQSTDDREERCLAGAVYFEAKSEPLEGQLAVAQVILNRANSGRFPDSVCAVVYQPSQFGFIRGGAMPNVAEESVAWKRAVAVAQIAMHDLWKPVAPKSLYFHAARVSPRWGNVVRVAAIGNHVFYR